MTSRKAVLRQIHGLTFAAKADSNHWVMMDGPEKLGGSSGGARPKELLLMALAGCTASDVVSILMKKRVPMSSFEIQVTANAAEEHPKVFTDIHLEYIVYGNGVTPRDVERAIELSTTKYCAVSAMLKPAVKLTHSYRIEQAPAGAETP